MTVELENVPAIISVGAGVQSSTLCLMVANGELPPVIAGVFADTQSEPAGVYTWLSTLRDLVSKAPHPFPIHTVTAGSLEHDTLRLRTSQKTGNKYIRALVPAYVAKPGGGRSLLGRKCTAEYKVRALLKKQREIAKVPRAAKKVYCRTLIGISWDEAHRMKPSQEVWAINEWPLVDLKMTRNDCLDWMQSHGYPRPPRSACVFCPFHSDDEWRRLRDEEPTEFKRAVSFDYALRDLSAQTTGTAKLAGEPFIHASLVPLDKVNFTNVPARAQIDLFGNDCTGLCGV